MTKAKAVATAEKKADTSKSETVTQKVEAEDDDDDHVDDDLVRTSENWLSFSRKASCVIASGDAVP